MLSESSGHREYPLTQKKKPRRGARLHVADPAPRYRRMATRMAANARAPVATENNLSQKSQRIRAAWYLVM